VTVTTSHLIGRRYSPHGHGLWLRPDMRTIVTTEQALREVAEQLEPPPEEDQGDD
jgi:hypothetical protein